jgi:hypothetical protein
MAKNLNQEGDAGLRRDYRKILKITCIGAATAFALILMLGFILDILFYSIVIYITIFV